MSFNEWTPGKRPPAHPYPEGLCCRESGLIYESIVNLAYGLMEEPGSDIWSSKITGPIECLARLAHRLEMQRREQLAKDAAETRAALVLDVEAKA